MKRIFLIAILVLVFGLLSAFLSSNSKDKSLSKMIDDSYRVELRNISSEEYCQMMGGKPSDEEDYDAYYYFVLRLTETAASKGSLFKELNSIDAIGGKINYLSNGITNDLSLITDSDTLRCSMSHWERTYNIRKDITVNIAFKKSNDENLRKFIWNDNLISGIPIKFSL